MIEYKGQKFKIRELADMAGVTPWAMNLRIRSGVPEEILLSKNLRIGRNWRRSWHVYMILDDQCKVLYVGSALKVMPERIGSRFYWRGRLYRNHAFKILTKTTKEKARKIEYTLIAKFKSIGECCFNVYCPKDFPEENIFHSSQDVCEDSENNSCLSSGPSA